jgi:hypothetical protein
MMNIRSDFVSGLLFLLFLLLHLNLLLHSSSSSLPKSSSALSSHGRGGGLYSLLAKERGSCLGHLSYSSLMGVEGLDASLDLWMGTFTGREVASRKSVIRCRRIISEWMGRNSDWEEDNDDLRLEELEFCVEMDDVEGWLAVRCLFPCMQVQVHVVFFPGKPSKEQSNGHL